MNAHTLARQRRDHLASLRATFNTACAWARSSSEFSDGPLVVMFGRGGEDWPAGLTAVHIQGGSVTDYVFERAAAGGRRFRALVAFQHGQQIPVPRALLRGPRGSA